MNVQEVWADGITGKGSVVSILDDGLEKDHPDISRNYVCQSLDFCRHLVILTLLICRIQGPVSTSTIKMMIHRLFTILKTRIDTVPAVPVKLRLKVTIRSVLLVSHSMLKSEVKQYHGPFVTDLLYLCHYESR